MSTKTYAAESWNDYVALTRSLETQAEVHSSSPDDTKSPPLRIILDKNEVKTFSEQSGRDIGIMYDSPYNTLVVDLVKDADGNEFAYERLLPKNDGAVVMIPSYKGRFILLNQYRHAIGGHQLCFPRGFGENGLSAKRTPQRNCAKRLVPANFFRFADLGSSHLIVAFRQTKSRCSYARSKATTPKREPKESLRFVSVL